MFHSEGGEVAKGKTRPQIEKLGSFQSKRKSHTILGGRVKAATHHLAEKLWWNPRQVSKGWVGLEWVSEGGKRGPQAKNSQLKKGGRATNLKNWGEGTRLKKKIAVLGKRCTKPLPE